MVSARCGRGARHLLGVDLVEDLEAERATRGLDAGLHAGVADRHAVDPEPGADAVVLDEQAVGVGDRAPGAGESAYDGAHLADRVAHRAGGVVGPFQHLGLAGLGRPSPAARRTSCGRRTLAPLEGRDAGLALGALGRGGGGVGGRPQPGLAAGRRCGRSRSCSPRTTRMPAPRSRPGHELLDLAVVEARRRAAAVLGEHLGEVAAVAQRGLRACVGVLLLRSSRLLRGLSIVGRCRLRPGLSAAVELVVTEGDTALALKTGDVPVLATPRVVTLAEEATVRAVDGELAEGTTSVGYRVQLDHLAPTAVGGHVRAEATLEAIEGRRLNFRVSVSDGHGLVAAGRITRVIVERDPLPGEGRRRLTGRPAGTAQRGTRAEELSIASSQAGGFSNCGEWPASGITTSSAPGTVADDVAHRLRGTWCPARPRSRARARDSAASSASWSGWATISCDQRRPHHRRLRRATCSRRTPRNPGRSASTRWYAGDPSRSSSSDSCLSTASPRVAHDLAPRSATSSGSRPGGGPAEVSMNTSARDAAPAAASTNRRITMPAHRVAEQPQVVRGRWRRRRPCVSAASRSSE